MGGGAMLAVIWVAACSGPGQGGTDTPEPTIPTEAISGLGRGISVDDGLWLTAPGHDGSGGAYGFASVRAGGTTLADATVVLLADGPDQIGAAMARCDLDADGRRDLVLGAPRIDDRGGAWWVLDPAGSIPLADQIFVAGPRDPGGLAGSEVGCGDLGGEPGVEVIWSAPEASGLGDAAGAGSVGVHRLSGGAAIKVGNVDTSYSGSHLAAVLVGTDLDGDGTGDLVVGAGGADRIHLILDEVVGTVDANSATTLQGAEGEGLGSSLAIGDVDGDGWSDLISGIPGAANDTGGVVVIPGPFGSDDDGLLTGLGRIQDRVRGVEPGDRAGTVVAVVDDLDGDGGAELLVGAPGAGGIGADAGAAYLVFGGFDGSLDNAATVFLGGVAGGRLGAAVAAGDLDGDGQPELVIAAPDADGVGAVYVFRDTDRGVVYPEAALAWIGP